MQVAVNKERYRRAQESYGYLRSYCELLDREGYWEQAETILKKNVYEMLDIYVQGFLIRFVGKLEGTYPEMCEFIRKLTVQNAFLIKENGELPENSIQETERLFASPPILLQLFGVRDKEHSSQLAISSIECLIEILAHMTCFNELREKDVIQYALEYFKRVRVFLDPRKQDGSIIDEIYIASKIAENRKAIVKEEQQDELLFWLQNGGKIKIKVPAMEAIKKEFEEKKKKKEKQEENFLLEDKTEVVQETTEKKPQEEENKKKTESVEKTQSKEELLKQALEELETLIGLQEVKKEIRSLVNLIKISKMRSIHGLPSMEMSYHMVFTGNPGTGKTTVARLIAKIYKELGILSKGTLVETDRAGLVAGYVGQTALKVKEVVERARGGVLFIDEAYSLSADGNSNDFGKEAVDTLVKLMEDYRDDLVVIVAGYHKEMKQFLTMNPGLVSRFNKYIRFEDYSREELMEILDTMAGKVQMSLTQESKAYLKENLENMEEPVKKEFGNARGIRNLFEKMVVNQANRLVIQEELTPEQLSIIEIEDVRELI